MGNDDKMSRNTEDSIGCIGDEAAATPPASGMSLLGMDRRAMEAERLARRQKQIKEQQQQQQPATHEQQSESSPKELPKQLPEQPPDQLSKQSNKRKAEPQIVIIDDDDDDETAQEPPSQRRKMGTSHSVPISSTASTASRASRASRSSTTPRSPTASTSSPAAQLPFPAGVVKKTYIAGEPRMPDDITIEEVLQKSKLLLAVLSSFQWDEEFMLKHVDVRRTKVLLVAFAKDDMQKAEMQENAPNSNVRFCFPPMSTNQPITGNMHSKLQLLKYSNYLRIVVPTGNLVSYDWGESGKMENYVFLIDLPRLCDTGRTPEATRTQFLDDLVYFLTAQAVDESLINSLYNYDFSATARYAFVHSVVGSHTGLVAERTGYCGLGRAVQTLGLDTKLPLQVDYICSSVGSLKDGFLSALYYACQGDMGEKEYCARSNKKSKSAKPVEPEWKNRFRVYFPSQKTVYQSRGSYPSGGTICLQKRWWDLPKFPRDILRDYQNVRSGMLTHTKMLFVRQDTASDPTKAARDWAYIGSANISESAWGQLVQDKQTKAPKLTCRNWECGVIVPLPASKAGHAASMQAEGQNMLQAFNSDVPVPMVLPGRKYRDDDGSAERRPWFFMEPTT